MCIRDSTTCTSELCIYLFAVTSRWRSLVLLNPLTQLHSREFEDVLNRAWRLLADPGRWLSSDEQMIKSTARAMFSLMRFNKCKPIKHGEFFHDDATLSPLSSARGGGGSTMVGVLMMRNNTPAHSRSSTIFSTTTPRENPAVGREQQRAVKHMCSHTLFVSLHSTR